MLDPQMMGEGPPPGLYEALQGAQGGIPPQGMGQMQAVGQMPPGGMESQGDPGQGQGSAAVEHLRQAIEHAQAALQAEPDDADSQMLAKVIQGLYGILSNRQKEQEQLLGGGNLRALSRSA